MRDPRIKETDQYDGWPVKLIASEVTRRGIVSRYRMVNLWDRAKMQDGASTWKT